MSHKKEKKGIVYSNKMQFHTNVKKKTPLCKKKTHMRFPNLQAHLFCFSWIYWEDIKTHRRKQRPIWTIFSHLEESYAYIEPLLRRWFKHWCFPLNIWSIVSSADIWRVALSLGTPAKHQNRKWLFLRHLSESGKFFE